MATHGFEAADLKRVRMVLGIMRNDLIKGFSMVEDSSFWSVSSTLNDDCALLASLILRWDRQSEMALKGLKEAAASILKEAEGCRKQLMGVDTDTFHGLLNTCRTIVTNFDVWLQFILAYRQKLMNMAVAKKFCVLANQYERRGCDSLEQLLAKVDGATVRQLIVRDKELRAEINNARAIVQAVITSFNNLSTDVELLFRRLDDTPGGFAFRTPDGLVQFDHPYY